MSSTLVKGLTPLLFPARGPLRGNTSGVRWKSDSTLPPNCFPIAAEQFKNPLGTAPKQMWKSKECLWEKLPPQNIHSLLGLSVSVALSLVVGCRGIARIRLSTFVQGKRNPSHNTA